MKPTIRGLAVRAASGLDRDAIEVLLREAGLPIPAPEDPPVTFLVAERDGIVIACTGWERYDERALVRSVAVSAAARGGEGRDRRGKQPCQVQILSRGPVYRARCACRITTDSVGLSADIL